MDPKGLTGVNREKVCIVGKGEAIIVLNFQCYALGDASKVGFMGSPHTF